MEKNSVKSFCAAMAIVFLSAGGALATPSTHLWAPSTDVQAYGVFHLTSDIYVATNGNDTPTITNLGLTTGVLPYEKLGLEVGFDHIEGNSPIFFNAKAGIPEGAYGELFPALAIGGYGFGTKSDVTDQNIIYAKAAKTIGKFGRVSAGFYKGNDKVLLDGDGNADEKGVMLAWERTMSEISDNLWLCVDYMSGDSSVGALSYGFSWKFAPNTSVIFAYVDQNDDAFQDSVSVQVDIDFDVFSKK